MADTLRILYVDDEPDLLEIGKLFLEQTGDFTVTTAISASEALRVLEQEQFDTIISDYQMPGTDGIQFLIEVRSRFGPVPFVLFTGRGREEVVIQAINSGADFYLQKGGEPRAQFAELSHKIKQGASRKRAEDALAESRENYRQIVETAREGIWIFDEQYATAYVNERVEEMLGYTAGEMIGKPFSYFIPKDDLPDHEAKVKERKRGFSDNHERRIMRKDGAISTFLVSTTPLIGKDGSFHGSFAMFTDITERKRADVALLRVNQKLNVLSQLTRKDLSNQICVLNSYLEVARTQATGQDHIIETLQKCNQAAGSIHEIIEYSKDYQDMGAKPPRWQNMKKALLLGLSYISSSEIKHRIETGDLEVFADPLLEKVCLGLFENSVKHGGHVNRIHVWHTTTPGGITILFEDDGIGIPQEKKEQIFLRSDGTRTSRASLIFVREILDITGITITETGEPGKGARFEMVVPKGAWRLKEEDLVEGSIQ
ncbi:MAG: PAS domain S-box protein [Methanomicrobiales archaeon]